jgi:hypothetical protein
MQREIMKKKKEMKPLEDAANTARMAARQQRAIQQ